MRAVSEGRARTPTDVGGHDVSGSAGRDGRCGMTADSEGIRRTGIELVKNQLLCHQIEQISSPQRTSAPAGREPSLVRFTIGGHPGRAPRDGGKVGRIYVLATFGA